jgi:hypothetical protein
MPNLLRRHTAKYAQFYNLCHPLVFLRKSGQGLIDLNYLDILIQTRSQLFVQGNASPLTTPFNDGTLTRMIDKDMPHRLSGHSEKVRTIFPIDTSLIDQTSVCFMNEGGRLKSVIRGLSMHQARRQAAKLSIDRFEDPVSGSMLCVFFRPAGEEDVCNVFSRGRSQG